MNSGFFTAKDPQAPPPELRGAMIAIGNFDGVHRGHQTIIGQTVSIAQKLGKPAGALTFEPHPADYFAGRPVLFRLTEADEKLRLLQGLGLDGVVTLTFDASLANLSAEQFIADVLVRRMAVGAVVIGVDFQFGKNRFGSAAYLSDAGGRYGFQVHVLPKLAPADEGVALSSSAIRLALESGDLAGAQRAMGHSYAVTGLVQAGRRLGRTLGVPTANIALAPTNRLAFGVYAVWTTVEGKRRPGVASFGVRPSVDSGAPLLEAHVLDFEGDLYGRNMRVEFAHWIRGEAKFDTLEALKAEMLRDIARARMLLRAPARV
jgi:riboflavin kinase/FMN adenylyltransferase